MLSEYLYKAEENGISRSEPDPLRVLSEYLYKAKYSNSSPPSERLLLGRLKEPMAADALTRTCRRLSQSSGIETLRSI